MDTRIDKLVYEIARADERTQAAVFAAIQENELLTAEQFTALQYMVWYISLKLDPEKEQAIKSYMAYQLYEEFRKKVQK